MDPRLSRRSDPPGAPPRRDAVTAFRTDLERIRFSPSFSRLAAVTQVISQGAAGQVVHNRLTHSIKVTAVARAIAVRLTDPVHTPDQPLLAELGGCDPVVVQAAASAHDLGHPPFGHLGERALDRLARNTFGLADGFEGNAQSFRILTELDVLGPVGTGLDLTSAVRAAVAKYPWARTGLPDPHPSDADEPPRGGGSDGTGSAKFSTYILDADEMFQALSAYPRITPWRQTVECSVMDVADDIAYSLHDLDDFHRAGILQHASVAAEFRSWTRSRVALSTTAAGALRAGERAPGHSLEMLRRRLAAKDGWVFDDEAFTVAVGRIGTDLVDGLLAVPFDSSIAAERSVNAFTASWIEHLQDSVRLVADPSVRSAHVQLDRQAWHEVAVLKFVHQRFVLDRPDLAMFQRGQASMIAAVVGGLDAWLDDPVDAPRAPRRLVDLVELAAAQYRELQRCRPELLWRNNSDGDQDRDIRRWARGRGICDYIASMTDDRAVAAAGTLAGHGARLWDSGTAL